MSSYDHMIFHQTFNKKLRWIYRPLEYPYLEKE